MDFFFKSVGAFVLSKVFPFINCYILYKCQAVEIEHPFYVEICLERPNACDMKEQSLPEPQFPD